MTGGGGPGRRLIGTHVCIEQFVFDQSYKRGLRILLRLLSVRFQYIHDWGGFVLYGGVPRVDG